MQRLEKNNIKIFLDTYGIKEDIIKNIEFFLFRDSVWMCTKEAFEFNVSGIKIVRKGLRIYRVFEHSIKPTMVGTQILGKFMTKKKVSLKTKEEAVKFMQGKEIELKEPHEEGFVVVCYEDIILGIGLCKNQKLKSQVPRSKRLLKILEETI